ncbi:MAG: hypothetical protein KDB53_14945, partial [Planctomycetes bacterium]|nr:hypothetical protein [Planctomycetota bacterium]
MRDFLRRFGANRRRLIIAGILGLLLAGFLIWFVSTVYDPFAQEIDDLMVLVPYTAEHEPDFVLRIRGFDDFIRGFESREFFGNLHRNDEFQRWLDNPRVKAASALRSVRDAWRRFQSTVRSDQQMPFDLQIVGDVTGADLVVWGNLPEGLAEGELPPFVVALRPQARSARIAVNAMSDHQLCSWFVEDELSKQGITIQQTGWGAILDLPNPERPSEKTRLGIARIETAILVGTDTSSIAAVARHVRERGLPLLADRRFGPGWVWEGLPGATIEMVMKRPAFDRWMPLKERILEPAWGEDLTQALEQFLPRFTGPDVYLGVEIDNTLRVRVAHGASQRSPVDPFTNMRPVDRGDLDRQLEEVLYRMPGSVFGYSYLQSSPDQLIEFLLKEPAIFTGEQRRLLYEQLAIRVPRFRRPGVESGGVVPDLTTDVVGFFAEAFAPSVGMLLFNKGQDPEVLHSEPGFALVFRIKDRAAIEGLVKELAVAFEQPFERYESPGMVSWENTRKRWLDDPLESRPGFAIQGDWFILTNWYPLFTESVAVAKGRREGFSSTAKQSLSWSLANLQHLNPQSRGFLFVDPQRLYAYMDDVKDGWVRERAEVTEAEKYGQRQMLAQQAAAQRIDINAREEW